MPTFLILLLVSFSIFLIGVFIFRPLITATRGGKTMAFLAFFALPLLCLGMGTSEELEHAKSTEFCFRATSWSRTERACVSTIRSIWQPYTFKIIAFLRTKPATHATRITPCLV